MKDPLSRTKVVLRHLPPSISESALRDQIDGRFSGRYKLFSFQPGKNSQKNQRHSRAYIDFQSPEDVTEFADVFYGHIFVNEKGTQIKALVEYAPSQRVPRLWSKKDGREGTILKDPEYLEFLEFLAKPAENLPSAEIQLEKREAERSGVSKESPIVTPLMDFVRQKRAAKSGSQRSSVNGKLSRRASGASNISGLSSKRGSEKRRVSTSVYVLRDNTNGNSNGKDKSTYMLMPRKEEQKLFSSSADAPDDQTGMTSNGNCGTTPISGSVEILERRVMLLKGKERETTHVSVGVSQQQSTTSLKNCTGSTLFKQGQRHEASGKNIRNILSNNDACRSRSFSETHVVNLERDKRAPRPHNPRHILKDHITVTANASFPDSEGRMPLDDKDAANNLLGSVTISEKNERHTRNKDRPDRGVWTPFRHADGTHGGDDTYFPAHLSEGGRANISTVENGSHRHVGLRGPLHGMKEVVGSVTFLEGKLSKRRGSTGYGSHEKQVWVQKSGSGS